MMRSQFRRPGGTSIAEDEASILPWIAGAVGIGVLLVVVFMLGGGEDEEAKTEQAAAKAQPASSKPRQAAAVNEPPPAPDVDPAVNRGEVAAALEADLQAKRLWSAVEIDPGNDTVLVIRSAYCGDAGLKASIEKLKPRMTSQGISKLECYERHGSLSFEQPL